MATTEQARRGRPPSAQKRAAILEAATAAFLDRGYAGTNLDDVAAAAGVSKQTVYRHFTDKKSLFMAAVEAAREQRPGAAAEQVPPILDPADLRGSLVRFGERMLDAVLTKRVAALRRVMIGELSRIPELRDLWAAGAPTAIAMVLIRELAELTERGVLDVPDPAAAVEIYFGLLSFRGMNNTAYGVTELSGKDRRRIAESSADLFVRAYQRS